MEYYGIHAIEGYLNSENPVGILYITTINQRIKQLIAQAHTVHIKIKRVSDSQLAKIARHSPKGPLLITPHAQHSRALYRSVDAYIAHHPHAQRVLLLDGVTDMGNIAAIIRSCTNFGVDALITTKRRTARDESLLAARSAGSIFTIPLITHVNIAHAIDTLKQNQFWVYGADMQGETLHRTNLRGNKIAIVVGDEHIGLRAYIKEKCDQLLGIPNLSQHDSLNVAVATAIILYEVVRQHADS